MLPGLDSAAAVRRAEQWRTEIGAQQVTHGAHLLRVSISLGVAGFQSTVLTSIACFWPPIRPSPGQGPGA